MFIRAQTHLHAFRCLNLQLQAAEERAALLASQIEQEGQLRDQLLAAREAELAARWERALEAAQAERDTLQQALDLANRQLAAAHREMEGMRVQFSQLRLSSSAGGRPGAGAQAAAHMGPGMGDNGALGSPGYAQSVRSSSSGCGGQGLGLPGLQAGAAGEREGSIPDAASPAGSIGRGRHQPSASSLPARQGMQQAYPLGSSGNVPASTAYQQQLHAHIDTLAGKLSSFQRAVEDARQAGQQASRQVRCCPLWSWWLLCRLLHEAVNLPCRLARHPAMPAMCPGAHTHAAPHPPI